MIVCAFSGSIWSAFLEIMCPRNFIALMENTHLLFNVTPAMFILQSTALSNWLSSCWFLPLNQDIIYVTDDSWYPRKNVSHLLMKILWSGTYSERKTFFL